LKVLQDYIEKKCQKFFSEKAELYNAILVCNFLHKYYLLLNKKTELSKDTEVVLND